MKKIEILNFPLSIGSYSDFIYKIISFSKRKEFLSVFIANAHMVIEAKNDKEFSKIIHGSEIITPDGQPLVWGLKMLNGIKQDRVAGMDLLPDLIKEMEIQGIHAFFYGGSETMLERTKNFLQFNYPLLKIAGFHSPPFGDNIEDADLNVIEKISENLPCIVFVILGCPKQEKWIASMRDKIQTVTIGVGGALPVFIGMQKRAPKWMQKNGLEWLFRLNQEPKRLFKRYIVTNSKFIAAFLIEYMYLKIFYPLGLKKK